ncbi:hypothetical protein TrCOL_g8811 [Triparma columacea]|uniref:Uncharacterized protein n=1 Tax=Triparma columacea TaxID=722753 RepID=A0A9W7G3V3_9STRA|nr:hypothetical protein TrCOL_g8811 [Triparma columacea]
MADWRETLFVWKGELEGVAHNGEALYSPLELVYNKEEEEDHASGKVLYCSGWESLLIDWEMKMSFKGSWLGSQRSSDEDSPLHTSCLLSPNPNDSLNTFKLNARLHTQSDKFLVFDMKGSYKLDNGGGHETYKDKRHTLVVHREIVFGNGVDNAKEGWQREGPNYMLAAARGTTEFGPFVSLGFVAVSSNGEPTLTLCRRYTGEDDPRSDSSVSDEDFLCNMLKTINSSGENNNKYGIGGPIDRKANFGEFIERHLPLAGEEDEITKDFLESNPDKVVDVNSVQIGLNRRPVEGRAKKRLKKS